MEEDLDLKKEIKKLFLNSLNTNTYFILLYTITIIIDGIYQLHIDSNAILMGYGVIVGKNIINHGINSTLNSKNGEMPNRQNIHQQTSSTNVDDKK